MGLLGFLFGHRKTDSERKQEIANRVARLATEIGRLHGKVVSFERKIPYIRNALQKNAIEKQVMLIEYKIRRYEQQHRQLAEKLK